MLSNRRGSRRQRGWACLQLLRRRAGRQAVLRAEFVRDNDLDSIASTEQGVVCCPEKEEEEEEEERAEGGRGDVMV